MVVVVVVVSLLCFDLQKSGRRGKGVGGEENKEISREEKREQET